MAAIGVLSSEPREYAVRPVMFSGTCKKETSEEHARLVKTVLEACNKQNERNNAMYRTVCIASDGEAKCGDALVIQTMVSELSPYSPIYAHLRPLEFLNLLVGPDDITADKDFKHIIKRLRNAFMRAKGVEVLGFCITQSILRSHLENNGVSSPRLRSLLNPNDKQDVVLAYSLLKEIWSLPSPPPDSDPTFALARHALIVYGNFARHLMLPYVCIDLCLKEQLIHLSAAAHLAFYLYRYHSAGTHFMHIMMSHGLHESWQGRCRESFRFHGQPASADVGDSYYFLGSADVGRKRRRMSDISLYIRIRRLLPYFGDDE